MITALQRQLAIAIDRNIYEDFALRHLSGNLMNTLQITYGEDDASVRVPAVRYDLKEYKSRGVIILHPEWGSYADKVDKTGGFSGTHQNYADRAIFKAVRETLSLSDLSYDIEVR